MTDTTHGLSREIEKHTQSLTDPAGKNVRTITEEDARWIAESRPCKLGTVYESALENEVWPLRYIRNRRTITAAEQTVLGRSHVAVIGAGGLGGYVIELLARIGIGHIAVIDRDRFDESNLNRQLLANIETIGEKKAHAAARRVASVNPAVTVYAHAVELTSENAGDIIGESRLAVDALDNLETRLVLCRYCRRLGIPMVHGAISGFEGRMMGIDPEGPDASSLFDAAGQTAETLMGTPPVAPAIIGSFQAMEAVKILLNRGRLFWGRMLYADLENGRIDEFAFSPSE